MNAASSLLGTVGLSISEVLSNAPQEDTRFHIPLLRWDTTTKSNLIFVIIPKLVLATAFVLDVLKKTIS